MSLFLMLRKRFEREKYRLYLKFCFTEAKILNSFEISAIYVKFLVGVVVLLHYRHFVHQMFGTGEFVDDK